MEPDDKQDRVEPRIGAPIPEGNAHFDTLMPIANQPALLKRTLKTMDISGIASRSRKMPVQNAGPRSGYSRLM
jgi:hypothetical protein